MTEKLREQISALADDELARDEHDLLLRRFGVDHQLGRCWERYHLIGEAMRRNLPATDTRGFADRVMAAINPEAAQPVRRLRSRVSRAAVGVAVATSVAVVALLALRYESLHPGSATGPAVIVPPASTAQPPFFPLAGKVTSASWNGTSPDVRAELDNYVSSHAEMSAGFGQQNVLPYFFVASFGTYIPPVPAHSASPKNHCLSRAAFRC